MEYVINPLSKKPIQRGGKTYIELLKQGVSFNNDDQEIYKSEKIVCEIGDKTEEELDRIKKEFNDANEEYCCHKGRGFLSGFLVKKRKKTTYASFSLELAKRSAVKIREFLDTLDDLEELFIERAIARIIDQEGQKLSKRFENCSKFYLLKNNFGEMSV
jgi:hypothetical protein